MRGEDYRARDAELRGAWRAAAGSPAGASPATLVKERALTPALALQVWLLREAASVGLLALWEGRDLTTVRTLRIVVAHPYDEAAQLRAAAECDAIARAKLRSEGRLPT